jgi:hypothetical protein
MSSKQPGIYSLPEESPLDAKLLDAEREDAQAQSQKDNIRMLSYIAFFFAAFVISEIIGALASGSLALLGCKLSTRM